MLSYYEPLKLMKIKDKLLINFTDNTNDLVDFIIVSDGVFSNTKSIIENKIIRPLDTFRCKGKIELYGEKFHCWEKSLFYTLTHLHLKTNIAHSSDAINC